MELLAWLWWVLATLLSGTLTIRWFLVSGWVSALLQIAAIVVAVYVLKYGWQRAPAELWRRTRPLLSFFVGWLRAREPAAPSALPPAIQVVRAKEFGDINISTLLSLLLLGELLLATRL